MHAFVDNIESLTLNNPHFRKVIFTGHHLQLVLMSLRPGEEIGTEVHEHEDQFFRVEQGEATFFVQQKEHLLTPDMIIVIPAGTEHNVINTGQEDLKLYTIYSPKHHAPGTLHPTKQDADEAEQHSHH